ncbi:MAG: hypothetical protein QXF56_05025 [Candidatus Micrarchaeia archaeon]
MATFLIMDLFKLPFGVVLTGEVRSDVLRVRMKANVEGKMMEVKAIEMAHRQVQEAKAGEKVGVVLSNADYNLLYKYKGKVVEFL